MKRILLGIAALAAFTSTFLNDRPAAAAEGEPEVAVDEPQAQAPAVAPLGRKQNFWRFGMGVRIGNVSDPSFNPFAKEDVLPQWSLEAQRTLFVRKRLSLSAGLGWDVGGRSGQTARGSDAGLLAHRLSVPIEARYHVLPWIYGFGKIAPGADYLSARLNDPSAPSTLVANGWAFSTDFSAGASFLLTPHSEPEKRLARVWVTPEVGYAWSTSVPLAFVPEGSHDDPRPVGATHLGSLALRGAFFRVGMAVSF